MRQRLNYEFSEAILRYTWHCAICGATAHETRVIRPSDAVPLPRMPKGWRRYWRPNDPRFVYFCCPAHGMQLLIDGMEVWSEKGPTVVILEEP